MNIAIVGMAFRFPGDITSEERFWAALRDSQDLVTSVSAERWGTEFYKHPRRSEPGRSVTFSAGQLSRIDEFDAMFFGISPREAKQMDPQQRFLLEMTWEAMENGGQVPANLAGSDCGVYIGISGLDYGVGSIDDFGAIDAYFMTGNTLSIAANRISYVFDLRGPSMAIDTACSSSMVALHQACQSLRNGESSVAIAGGVHLLLHPYPFVGFTKASMLSAGGRCKTFDASGDGYVRSEGGAILFLKPLDAALADGDPVHAVILASGVNTDGYKSGITIPKSTAQADLMRSCCAQANITAQDIIYVEAHGTGTAVGDPIETNAIGNVIGKARETPLYIGSVKSNLGHLEPASGMAGLIKTVLCLKNRALPPTLHLQEPNPHIDFDGLNLQPVTRYTALPSTAGPLRMGVNSFGFGGANAHVLLEEAPSVASGTDLPETLPIPPLFLSARSPDALKALATRYAERLADATDQDYYGIAHATVHRRQFLDQRLAIYGTSAAEIAGGLRQFADGRMVSGTIQENALNLTTTHAPLAFVYSGNGAQWLGMGRKLLQSSPVFRDTIAEIDALLAEYGDLSIMVELMAEPAESQLHLTEVAQPALFAVQVAITRLLRERGLDASAAMGHSVGEIAAAWAMGALDLRQAVCVIHERSSAQAETQGAGRMAAVALSSFDVTQEIVAAGLEHDLVIAAYNSPKATTLSGSLSALEQLQARLRPRRIFFQLLDLDYAFHSWHMDGLKPRILRDLAKLNPKSGTGRFVSTVTGTEVPGEQLDAHYWWNNIRKPVQFEQAVMTLAEAGYRVFLEIGPHAIMQRYVSDSLAAAACDGRVLATLKRNDDGEERIAEAAYRAYLLGTPFDLNRPFPHPAPFVPLPSYPWQRERFWHAPTSESGNLMGRARIHPLLGYKLHDAEAAWENQIDPFILPYLRDHVVGGAIVLPAAAYAELALAASAQHFGSASHEIEELEIRLPIVLDEESARTLRFELDPRDGSFRIKSRPRLSDDEWTINAVGRMLGASLANEPAADPVSAPDRRKPVLTSARHYQLCQAMGLDYGPAFQGMAAAWQVDDTLLASLTLPSACSDGASAYLLHPTLTDACFQSLLALFQLDRNSGQRTYLPVRIGRLRLFRPGAQPSWCTTRVVRHSPHSLLAEFTLRDAEGRTVAQLEGCRFRAAPIAARGQGKVAEWVYGAQLKPRFDPDQASLLPANARLGHHVLHVLEQDEASLRRAHHFAEAVPLLDALVGAFAQRAFATRADASGDIDLGGFKSQPYLDWLVSVTLEDGLIERSEDGWRLTEEVSIAPQEIWLTILGDNPSYLPELALAGRVGRNLVEILDGRLDGRRVVDRLQAGALYDQLLESSPAYRALNRGLRGMISLVAQSWPENRRLRILDISPASKPLTRELLAVLPAERCDYVIADSDEDALGRAEAEFGHLDWVSFAKLDQDTWAVDGPNAEVPVFDIILAAHSLHRVEVPVPALANLKGRLALNGLLVVMERQPDRFTDFTQGLRSEWWQPNGPRLADMEVWSERLREAGYTAIKPVIEPQSGPLHTGVYLLLASNPDTPDAAAADVQSARWLLLTDQDPACREFVMALQERMRERGQDVIVAEATDADIEVPDYDHVVQLAGLAATDDDMGPLAAQEQRCLTTLDLVQSLDKCTGDKPRLWLLTSGGAILTSPDARQALGQPEPAQAPLWGFGRVIANEHPDLNCTLIDLRSALDQDMAARLTDELLFPDGEDEILLCADSRRVTRMRPAHPAERKAEDAFQNVRLDFAVPGQLKNLQWHACPMGEPAEDEVEIQPKAVGLNFRDVMYAMGLLSDEAVENGFAGPSMGMELSGIVTRVGSGVSEFKPGDAVIAFSPSGFAKRAITKATSVLAKPEPWSFEEAATVPTVFFTVYYALHYLARLQPGEKVLIHGAAGGVGIAAIQLARHLGAEVYATAGSDEKRDFVRLLGADHVMSSRSLAYADEILALTGGKGVDVVINSLAGEAINRNFRILRPFGRFLELGKRDFYENTRIGLRPFKDNITYYGIDADQLMVERPELTARLFREMMTLFRDGVLQPLPHRVFTAGRIVDAFRYMQQAKQIGKIVVSFQDHDIPVPVQETRAKPLRLVRKATYLVTGGLGGFGLKTARWLAEHGAGHVVLLGRRGADAPEAGAAVAAVEAAGAKAHVMACDVADAERLEAVIAEIGRDLPPIRGIVHAAMVLDDGLIRNLDHDRFAKVLRPKIAGAWNLHRLTRHLRLDLFVLYSSATTFIGNPGQANYVAANAYLEALAAYRRSQGLPATAVCWGGIADVGYLARNEAVKDSLETHLGSAALASDKALAQLGEMIADQRSGIAVIDFDWHTVSRFLPAMRAPRFDALRRGAGPAGAGADAEDIQALLANHSEEEAREIIRGLLTAEIAHILRLPPERIPADRSLYDIGMDSLMGVELVLSIEKRFGINLPAMALSEGPTIQRISERLVHDLLGQGSEDTLGAAGDAQMKDMMAGMAKQHGLDVSGEEIDAAITEMRAQRLEAGGRLP